MVFGKHFGKYYLRYCWAFLFGIGVLITIDWVQLDVSKYTGQIIDALMNNIDGTVQEFVTDLTKKIIIIVLIMTLGRFVWRFTIFGAARQIEFELRKEMFNHALLLNQSYYSHHKVGAIMTYFVNDLSAIREAYGPGLLTLIDGVFLGGFAIYRMFSLDSRISAIVIIPIIATLFIIILSNRSLKKSFRVRQDSYEVMSDYIQETFSGITVIKAFVREVYKIFTFNKHSKDFQDKSLEYLKKMVKLRVVVSVAINLTALIVMTVGVILISQDQFTTGELTEYMSYYGTLLWPLNAITRFLNLSSQANASSKRIGAFLDEKEDDVNSGLEITDLKGDIKFNHLTFTYEDATTPSLIDINLDIKEGEFIGIIGRTGSGKTTLVELLAKIHPVEKGSILVGGYDIMDLKTSCLRDALGYVPQDNFLYSDKISRNIAFSDTSIKNIEIESAGDGLSEAQKQRTIHSAQLADIDANISQFQESYQTILGERGVTVSGGQKQRISIARALYKDPKILILDDSVSAVDINTEEIIIDNLLDVRKNKTTILIAHRVSSIKRLDKIVVLNDSKIVGYGTYDELIVNSPEFIDIVKRQELEQELEIENNGETK